MLSDDFLNHLERQLWFGAKFRGFGNVAFRPEFFVLLVEPYLGKIEFGIQQSVTTRSGVTNEYARLAVFNLPFTSAILAVNAGRVFSLLCKIGAVYRNHAIWIIGQHANPVLIALFHLLFIPRRIFQKELHRTNCLFVPIPQGNWFDTLAIQIAKQSLDIRFTVFLLFTTRITGRIGVQVISQSGPQFGNGLLIQSNFVKQFWTPVRCAKHHIP